MNGYEYTRQLKAKIAESPTHTLDFDDAIAYIRFYGLRNLFNAQGDMQFVGQVAIDALDKAISENDDEVIDTKDEQSVNDWMSTNERLPERGRDVLIYYPEWNEIQVARLDYDGILFNVCGEFDIGARDITHWMPLPEPPKDGDAE